MADTAVVDVRDGLSARSSLIVYPTVIERVARGAAGETAGVIAGPPGVVRAWVRCGGDRTVVRVRVEAGWGVSANEVASAVRSAVRGRVETLTSVKVDAVDVDIRFATGPPEPTRRVR